jgi:hypothetical protein
MYGDGGSASSKKGKQKRATFCDDSDSDDDGISNTPTTTSEAPWRREFNRYLRGEDELPENMTLVQWWGVSGHDDSSNSGKLILPYS